LHVGMPGGRVGAESAVDFVEIHTLVAAQGAARIVDRRLNCLITLLDIIHATPESSQRSDYQRQSVSIVADFPALRG
jgi:hypothetical protein